jgi:hypothetical protein
LLYVVQYAVAGCSTQTQQREYDLSAVSTLERSRGPGSPVIYHCRDHGWYRHVSLVMLAFAMMAVISYRANNVTPPRIPTITI